MRAVDQVPTGVLEEGINLDPRARAGVGQVPLDDAVIEQFVDKNLKPVGETAPSLARRQTADAVEYLPDGDGREAEALVGDEIEKCSDTWFGLRPHHLGDDVRVYEPRKRSDQVCSSPEDASGL